MQVLSSDALTGIKGTHEFYINKILCTSTSFIYVSQKKMLETTLTFSYISSVLIQSTVLRAASHYFHRGLRKCFANDYARLFDSPVCSRLDNDVSGHSPTYIPAAG